MHKKSKFVLAGQNIVTMPAGKGKTPNGQEAQSKNNSETWISESQKVNSFEAAYILKDELGR